MGTPEHDATIKRWCETLAVDDTAVAPTGTVRADTLAAVTRPRGGLPRISLAFAGHSTRPPPTTAAEAPGRVADLRVRDTLGEGGMGRVHLASQHSLGRDVAVKTLKPDAPAEIHATLVNEGYITGSLEHPGIIPVHALGIDDGGRPLLVMKRIEGVEWSALLEDPEHPAWQWIPDAADRLLAHVQILLRICDAVHFAHSRGIVHRDIKPDNVMIGRFGEVYLVDWGIASEVSTDGAGITLAGTPCYMAPEMVDGSRLDARTDVYLLGATLHQVVSGTLRHPGSTIHELLDAALTSAPVRYDADVPEELARLCNHATDADPGARPDDALAFRNALSSFVRHRGSRALSESASERLSTLQTMLADAGDADPPADLAEAHRLANESRFGFVHALREWPDSPEASAGLQQCLSTMLELELRLGNAAGARVLVDQLDEVPAELARRVTELEAAVASRGERDERLAALEHERDQDVSRPQRVWAAAAILMITIGVSAVAVTKKEMTTADLLDASMIVFITCIAVVLAFRKALTANAFNRRVVGIVVIVVTTLLVHRGVAHDRALDPSNVLLIDSLMFAAIMAVAGLTVARVFFVVTALFVGATAVTFVAPQLAVRAFSVAEIVAIAIVVYVWRRRASDA